MTRIIESEDGDEEKTRIMYFCPNCQNVALPSKAKKRSSKPKVEKVA
jgi:hypothetical protein